MSVFNGLVHITGGISVSGIALILLATHKCVMYWPASHALVTYTRSSGTKIKPPLCKGRWHFRKKMTEGL